MSFVSVLKTIGGDFKKGLDFILPWAETVGEVGVTLFFPALGPAYNATVSAVALAEQKYNLLGQQNAGPQKLADVLQLLEPVIAQTLKDAGKDSSTQSVISYINSVVMILDSAPTP